jgi:hypothetical protein
MPGVASPCGPIRRSRCSSRSIPPGRSWAARSGTVCWSVGSRLPSSLALVFGPTAFAPTRWSRSISSSTHRRTRRNPTTT